MKLSKTISPIIWITVLSLLPALLPGSEHHQFNHQPYDSLLQKYVNEQGMVDYAGIKQNPGLLNSYLNKLENVNADSFKTWSRNEKMAFWINAYNAITIEGIARNYPIDYGGLFSRMRFPKNSIRQIGDFWDTVFIKVMGEEITLDDIEHEILRKKFQEPHIHSVLVCAAVSCPQLENQAFKPEDLDRQLEQASRDFVNNPKKVRLDTTENVLYLSSIFDWYKKDYEISPDFPEKLSNEYDDDLHGVIDFVLKYFPEEKVNYILQHKPEIKFLDYDWTLNEQT